MRVTREYLLQLDAEQFDKLIRNCDDTLIDEINLFMAGLTREDTIEIPEEILTRL